ncbi:MAG: DUF421 domain-containing protein [Ruminococcaceae bacterium]|nr:DUF421 domain-containing protein [Oscillospiraceae bacterium]
MVTVLLRTLIIYAFLLITMRFMGKRQLGELEISELVITFLLSEIASLPITNTELPLLHAIIPITTLMALEVILSAGVLKLPKLKSAVSIRPALIIYDGKLLQSELRGARISNEEFLSQLRQKDIFDILDVEYAVLEPNGQISVISKSNPESENTLMHIIISDGVINHKNLALVKKSIVWLEKMLKGSQCAAKDVFLMTADVHGRVRLVGRGGDGKIIPMESQKE